MTSLAFTACGDDDDANASTNPQIDVAGTYAGEWTIEVVQTNEFADGSPTTEKSLYSGVEDGNVILTAGESYIADVSLVGTKLSEYIGNEQNVKVNVIHTTSGYTLYNPKNKTYDEDGVKMKVANFTATISENKELIIENFSRSEEETKEVQVGVDRRGRPIMKASTVTTNYTISFTGTKQ